MSGGQSVRRWFCRLGWHYFWHGYYGATLGQCVYCGQTEADVMHATDRRFVPEVKP
jgi:hypothetical protein